eukprot:GEMP01070818.1.p1 GENE.GEMP01070818.1~~GEMP01070818.1.p1  ORF type:complete len:220 (+),score=35.72 GEMP01070818.1:109-768(+)
MQRSNSAPCPDISSFPVGDARKQIPSQFTSAAAFSFGKPLHGVGKFRIEPRDIRCAYLQSGDSPGVGSYNMDKPLPHPVTQPKYSFGKSGVVRDTQVRRYTELGHVVGHCNLNNPGPHRYFGGEKNSLLWRQPKYSLGDWRPEIKGYWTRPTPGPDVYRIETKQDILRTGNHRRAPRWKSLASRTDNARVKRSSLIVQASTPANMGPGSYRHATGLVAT